MINKDFSTTDEETQTIYYLIIRLLKNGKSIQEVINKKVQEGISFEKAKELVSIAIEFRKSPQYDPQKERDVAMNWLKNYIDSPKFHEDFEKKKIENRELFSKNPMFNSLNLNDQSNSFKKYQKASSGKNMMISGLIFLFIGGVITAITYLISGPGDKYIICYGLLFLGAIYTFIGFVNWNANQK